MEKLIKFFILNKTDKIRSLNSTLDFEDIQKQLHILTNLVCSNSNQINIGASLSRCGFINDTLLLPAYSYWTDSADTNLNLLRLLILKSVAVKHLDINIDFSDADLTSPRLYLLLNFYKLNIWLDRNFPKYSDLQEAAYKVLINKYQNNFYLQYWKKLILARDSRYSEENTHVINTFIKSIKKYNEVSPLLHASIPLPNSQLELVLKSSNSNNESQNNKIKTEKKRKRTEHFKDNDQNKKNEISPLNHSFEKTETLDDYKGAKKINCGEDELQEHENAIDELDLNNSTREGAASSIYKQDSLNFAETSQQFKAKAVSTEKHQYPEWNYKKNQYITKYCTVFESKIISKNTDWLIKKNQFYEKNITAINYWKNYFNLILNEPTWEKRLTEGQDVDIDAYVNIFPDLKNFSGIPKIYQNKNKLLSDFSLNILIDTSYSTETWLNGRKVIDIIKQSIAIFGLSTSEIINNVTITATYSKTHNHISCLLIKEKNENWDAYFKNYDDLASKEYTRLGAAIRHETQKILKNEYKNKFLILITDCKPTDIDPYEGNYGEKDVKMALTEAQHSQIKTLILTATDLDFNYLTRFIDNPKPIFNESDFCKEVGLFLKQSL